MKRDDGQGGLAAAELPAPVALNPECVSLPMSTPVQVLKALDALAGDFNSVISKPGDPTKAGMIIGGGAGVAMGFGPGGLLFGPIGAAIGGTLGTVAGGVIVNFIPQALKDKLNPAEAAQRSVESGNYRQAVVYLNEVIKRVDEPGVMGFLQKVTGSDVGGNKHEQRAMYLAALAMVHHANGDDKTACEVLKKALTHSEHNVVLLDLLQAFGEEVDEILLKSIESVDDEVVKTALLERYAVRHSWEAWVISMLASAYRMRYRRSSAQLDQSIARRGGDVDWMLDVAHATRSKDVGAAAAARDVMAEAPELASTAEAILATAIQSVADLVPGSSLLDRGETALEQAKTESSKSASEFEASRSERDRTTRDLESLRAKATEASTRASQAETELRRVQQQLELARKAADELTASSGSAVVTPELIALRAEAEKLGRSLSAAAAAQERSAAEAKDLGAKVQELDSTLCTLQDQVGRNDRLLKDAIAREERKAEEVIKLRDNLRSLIKDLLSAAPVEIDEGFQDEFVELYRQHRDIALRVLALVLADQSDIRLKPLVGCRGVGEKHLDVGRVAFRAYATLSHSPKRRWLSVVKKEHQHRAIKRIKEMVA